MNGDDDNTREYERIIEEIRGRLTGDPQHDARVLQDCAGEYREHPQSKEIIREIGRMLFACLPPEARASVEQMAAGVHAPFETGLAEAEDQLSAGNAEDARRTLEGVIEQFDTNGIAFADDTISEYRILYNTYEAALYQKLFEPTREVRGLPYDMYRLHLRYGEALVELGDLDSAERALHRARSFNPVNPLAIFELSEVCKLQQRWKEFHDLSTFGLSVSFRGEQAARAYRNLGFYYIEEGDYDVAAACYQKSGLIDEQSNARCARELMYIEQRTGKPLASAATEAVDETLRANGIQTSLSGAVREALTEVDGADTVEQDITETVRTAMLAHNAFSGRPEQLAALLLSCSGEFRAHPKTPEVVRRIGWMLADKANPDTRAKLSLAVMRLADGDAVRSDGSASPGLSFVDELHLWATRPGLEGTVGVTHTETGRVVAQYNYADGNLAINSELAAEGSDFPRQSLTDAMSLVTMYVGDLTLAESRH